MVGTPRDELNKQTERVRQRIKEKRKEEKTEDGKTGDRANKGRDPPATDWGMGGGGGGRIVRG